ncbi:IMP cyclohydrolase [Kitasatospora sp. NPDC058965]|uniref:IMP cyclohydrolase n=1 Tax=Kitasatospora sp. NPDC058965 TaxID=3346682 RepID=UPI0036A28F12
MLTGNPYPGRGVLWCRSTQGAPLGAYFLTGRSPASRARTLGVDPAGDLLVAPSAAGAHDHLRHYVAARRVGDRLVYGNGEQVATVADRLADGLAAPLALDELDYEPDPPIHTPRLTVVADFAPGTRTWYGAARHSAGARPDTDRLLLSVGALAPGEGVLLTTYRSDGEQVATGAPFTELRIGAGSAAELLDELWAALPGHLRVGAAVFPSTDLTAALVRQ